MLNTIQQDILFDDQSLIALFHGHDNSAITSAAYNDCTNNFNDCTNIVYPDKIIIERHGEDFLSSKL